MTKAIFALTGLMLILSPNIFGQPSRLHNRNKPAGIITEIGIPALDAKASSTKARKSGNNWIGKWEGPDLDAHSNPMARSKGRTIKR